MGWERKRRKSGRENRSIDTNALGIGIATGAYALSFWRDLGREWAQRSANAIPVAFHVHRALPNLPSLASLRPVAAP